jgi:replicative DNA helicase
VSDRVPPHDADAEASVLGAVLLRNDALDQVELAAEEFYDPRHREVFAAMRSLQAKRRPIDPVTLEGELARTDKLLSVGGLSFVSELMDIVPTADNVAHYAASVADAALKRRVIVSASEVAARAFRADVTGDEILGEYYTAATRIEKRGRDTALTMRDASKKYFLELGSALEAKARGEKVSLALSTGLATLDCMLNGGLPRANMHILAGRPSMGKSALARTISGNVNAIGRLNGIDDGVHVISAEDTAKAYVMRQFADEAEVDLGRLWNLDVSRLEWQSVSAAASSLYEQREHWIIDDARGLSIADVALRVKRKKRENRTAMVVIDYAQLLSPVRGARYESREQEIAAVSKGAADLARDEDVVVMLLSQLNRNGQKREDQRPTLEDLRGSGALEQDADVVLMVHRPEWYLEKQDGDNPDVRRQLDLWRGKGQVLLEKGKNMRAPNRTVLQWDGKSATYRDRQPRGGLS